MKHNWLWWTPQDVETERRQLTDEGMDISPLREEFEALRDAAYLDAGEGQAAFNRLLDHAQELTPAAGYAYDEPSELDEIRNARPEGPRALSFHLDEAALLDRFMGAWLGRCAGCLLGKPIEGIPSTVVWPLLSEGGAEGLADYLWRMDIPSAVFAKHGLEGVLDFGRGLTGMPSDDDMNYTVIGQKILKLHGGGFTPEHVADCWQGELPLLSTCTAERVAYRNFANQIVPPHSAMTRNPYREWIGAQIRADAFGYAAAGRPEMAAEFAWRDASISHRRNGIYGEMWVAAMLAASAAETDIRTIIQIGLSEIPVKSRLAEGIRAVLQWHEEGLGYAACCGRIHTRWNESLAHDWCHTISNAQIVAMALLWSGGDFEAAITRAVYPCFDTDCNGATVGSIVGMMNGAERLPKKWTTILADALHTNLQNHQKVRISAMAQETLDIWSSLRRME